MPAALLALQSDEVEVLNAEDAEEIRGQWWLRIPNPSGYVFFQGHGQPFVLKFLTVSAYNPNRVLGLRFTIGH
jgi:hypothetical protein